MTMHSQELLKQAKNHTAVKDRLWGKPPKQLGITADEIGVLAKERARHKQEIEAFIEKLDRAKQASDEALRREKRRYDDLAEVVKKLRLDLADARARILYQADLIKHQGNPDEPESGLRRSVRDIVAEVLMRYPGVTWEDIKGIRRSKHLVEPRHACIAAVYHERQDLSLPKIGQIFGGRDHSTVLNSVDKQGLKRRTAV